MAEEKEEVVEVDEFEEAFKEAIEEEGGEEEAPTEDLEPKDEEEEAPTPKEEEPVEEEPAEEEPKEEAPAEKTLAELQEDLDALNQKHSTLQGMYNSEVKKDKAPKEEPISEEPEEEEEDFAPVTEAMSKQIGELDSVKALKEEYGDEIGGALNDVAGLVIKSVMGDVSKRLKNQFGEVSEMVNPLQVQYAQSGRDAFDNSVIEAHPDYHTYVENGELEEWVESQPGSNGKAFQAAYTEGDTQDVIELVAAFRKDKGYSEEKQKTPEEEEEVDTSKLEDMEVVDTKKTPISGKGKGAVDMNDFDGAWKEA